MVIVNSAGHDFYQESSPCLPLQTAKKSYLQVQATPEGHSTPTRAAASAQPLSSTAPTMVSHLHNDYRLATF